MRALCWVVMASSLNLLLATGTSRAADVATNVFYRVGPVAIHGNEADLASVGAGVFDFPSSRASPASSIEYRFGRKVFFVGEALGLVANTDGGLFGYVAAYIDASMGNVYLTPEVAIGGYHQGNGRDLGQIFQFRASGDLTWRFANGTRLGIRFAHISNADTAAMNPGEEELFVVFGFPLGPYL